MRRLDEGLERHLAVGRLDRRPGEGHEGLRTERAIEILGRRHVHHLGPGHADGVVVDRTRPANHDNLVLDAFGVRQLLQRFDISAGHAGERRRGQRAGRARADHRSGRAEHLGDIGPRLVEKLLQVRVVERCLMNGVGHFGQQHRPAIHRARRGEVDEGLDAQALVNIRPLAPHRKTRRQRGVHAKEARRRGHAAGSPYTRGHSSAAENVTSRGCRRDLMACLCHYEPRHYEPRHYETPSLR